jgi:alkanesulfonate monooxygenase SsuD/methylene tetrahydromethanopterin reductase-like flavin-dependent oxidoreductase (luciferase family)
VQVGVALSQGPEAIAEAVMAEELGYDYVSTGEHVFFHSPTANSLILLAGAAAVTKRIRLLSSVMILPLYPAALAAKMVATLSDVANGRFDMGVGSGGDFSPEFIACGVPPAERGARTTESIEVVKALLAGERVSFAGEHVTIPDLRLDPVPAVPPRIWMGGRKDPAMRRAAKYADFWIPYMFTPQMLEDSLKTIRKEASNIGRLPTEVSGAIFLWGMVATESADARATAVRVVSEMYNQDFTALADKYLLSGNPDEVVARVTEYRNAGAEAITFAPACPPDRRQATLELFASEVMPRLQAL